MNPHADNVQRVGSTIYVLNARGHNRWSAQVQPGRNDNDERISDSECESIAEALARFGTRPAAEPNQSGSAGEAGQPFYDLAWQYGATQHTSFAGDELEGLTFTPNDFEAFCAALSRQAPAAPTQALLGWTRYEKARKLNPAQWAELHQRNLRGENFDDMIDALPATTMTQQDTTDWRAIARVQSAKLAVALDEPGAKERLDAVMASSDWRDTPPAEKQAAPSGGDNHG
jgi:hypothetical protein